MKKRQESYPTFKKIDSQDTLTKSQWVAKKRASLPKFTTTETIEEFLARGGEVETGEAPKHTSKGTSRFRFSERHSGFRSNTQQFRKLANKDNAIGRSKESFVAEQLEKRIKRKKPQEGD